MQIPNDAAPLLRQIRLHNLLSYGPDAQPIDLHSLNVLIGPNGSGKSNLIEAIALLRSAPGDLRAAIRQGGGVREWVWKGSPQSAASLEAVVTGPGSRPLRHLLSFREENQAFHLEDERIDDDSPSEGSPEPHSYYRFQQGRLEVTMESLTVARPLGTTCGRRQ